MCVYFSIGLTEQTDRGLVCVRVCVCVYTGDRAIDEVVDIMKRVRIQNSDIHTQTHTTRPKPGWFESTWRQSKDTHRDCDVSDDSACVARVLRGPRHRIEHFQHMRSADSARVAAQFGVGATPNPQHLVADGAMMYDRLGDERAGKTIGLCSPLLEAHMRVVRLVVRVRVCRGRAAPFFSLTVLCLLCKLFRAQYRTFKHLSVASAMPNCALCVCVYPGPGRSYAFNTLLKAGLVSGMASDWPVADIYPMESVVRTHLHTCTHEHAHTHTRMRGHQLSLSTTQDKICSCTRVCVCVCLWVGGCTCAVHECAP